MLSTPNGQLLEKFLQHPYLYCLLFKALASNKIPPTHCTSARFHSFIQIIVSMVYTQHLWPFNDSLVVRSCHHDTEPQARPTSPTIYLPLSSFLCRKTKSTEHTAVASFYDQFRLLRHHSTAGDEWCGTRRKLCRFWKKLPKRPLPHPPQEIPRSWSHNFGKVFNILALSCAQPAFKNALRLSSLPENLFITMTPWRATSACILFWWGFICTRLKSRNKLWKLFAIAGEEFFTQEELQVYSWN